MSHAKPDKAICDAGLKAQSVDSGLPIVYGRDDVKYIKLLRRARRHRRPQGRVEDQ
jgi:3-hydroxy-D-aspartate aldolase